MRNHCCITMHFQSVLSLGLAATILAHGSLWAADWQVLTAETATATAGVKLQPASDGALMAHSPKPGPTTYTITTALSAGTLAALRLEVLPHKSLPEHGPGRAANGNFILSHFKAAIRPAAGKAIPVRFQWAGADYEQNGWGIDHALSGKDPERGWAVSGAQGKAHTATFVLAAPFEIQAGTKLEVQLVQSSKRWADHTIGHFRLLVMTNPKAAAALLPKPEPDFVPVDRFVLPDGLEAKVWARTPLFYNPVNMDIDGQGRVWILEGMNYSPTSNLRPEGDRIMVIEDTDGDGAADSSHMFVQEKRFQTAMGVGVIGNRVYVSQPPAIIVYTDVDGDARFNPEIDKREELVKGFLGHDHGHGLHEIFGGPDGELYFSAGNYSSGPIADRRGRTFRIGSFYNRADNKWMGKASDDGHVYVGGTAFRVKADGTGLNIVAHNMRNPVGLCLDSFGNIYNNDNDDPPCCRTSWLMDYADLGYTIDDGRRRWGTVARPGQSRQQAHWRQADPGSAPAGDIYGPGAPCGMTVYENGSLGPKYRGLVLSCETVWNTVFGYHAKPDGAGMKLERFDFFTSNPQHQVIGGDASRRGGWLARLKINNWFRPSDVTVGPDGAIYVADWFDKRVGGHRFYDKKCRGTIYRIAPKGAKLRVPPLNLKTVAGQIEALKNPAVNVRQLAVEALRESGEAAVPALTKLLKDENPFIQARAVWLLPHTDAGRLVLQNVLSSSSPRLRACAVRACRRAGRPLAEYATAAARDDSPMVRREVALSLRDQPFEQTRDILVDLAKGYDGKDRWYVEAIGTGCIGQESAAFNYLQEKLKQRGPDWDAAFAGIVWRLHPPEAVPALLARGLDATLSEPLRRQAVDTLAFIPQQAAGEAMVEIAVQGPDDLRAHAAWWVKNRNLYFWRPYRLTALLGKKRPTAPRVTKVEPTATSKLPPLAKLLSVKGDAGRGNKIFHGKGACFSCHQVNGKGMEVGPDLSKVGQVLDRKALTHALLDPSAAIALGYETVVIQKKDDSIVSGFVQAEADPLLLKIAGGETIGIDKKDIKRRKKVKQSLMLPASSLGLSAQELMDVVAYLQVSGNASATGPAGSVSVLIVTGAEHPAHNWRTRTVALKEIFAEDPRFKVTVAEDPEFLGDSAIFEHDVILLNFYSARKNYPGEKARGQLKKFVADGGGLFVLHFACGAFSDWPEYANLTGLIFTPKHQYKGHHDRRQPFLVNIIDSQHQVMKGLKPQLQVDDELYYCMGGKTREFRLLATARSKNTGKDHPMAFCLQYGKGLVFNTPLGHDDRACKMPDVAELIRRGAAWAAAGTRNRTKSDTQETKQEGKK